MLGLQNKMTARRDRSRSTAISCAALPPRRSRPSSRAIRQPCGRWSDAPVPAKSGPAPGNRTRGRIPPATTSHCSDGAQIFRRGLARLSISNNIEKDLLSLVQARQPGAFNRADVHENVFAAVIRLDEAEAFLAIEPLHGSLRHIALLSVGVTRLRVNAAGSVRSRFGETRQSDAGVRRGQVVRPKLDWRNVEHCGLGRKGHRKKKAGYSNDQPPS